MSRGRTEGRYRQIIDAGVNGTWLREKRYGQIGYREPQPKPEPVVEKYIPREKGPKTPLAWRAAEHGPFQVGSGRRPTHVRPIKAKPGRPVSLAPDKKPARTKKAELPARPEKIETPLVMSASPAPDQLPVPIPSQRVRPVDVTYASRDGQAEFRAAILAAYGRCAVTGCQVEAVLQAAHIIPYVDARSNLISNGLCLRSDIHCLYDRNLIRIAGDGGIVVDEAVECSEYRALHGRQIVTPEVQANKPNPALMNVRHEYV